MTKPSIAYPDPCFICPACGPAVVDQDGCCRTCGADAPVGHRKRRRQRMERPSVIAEIPKPELPPSPNGASPRYEDLPALMNQGRWQEATLLLIAKVDRLYRDTASLTALRGTLETLVDNWRAEYERSLNHDREYGLRDVTVRLSGKAMAADELSTALAASQVPHAQTDRD